MFYSSLVLSLGMGVFAQQEMAKCEPGWEWVCRQVLKAKRSVVTPDRVCVAEPEFSRSRSLYGRLETRCRLSRSKWVALILFYALTFEAWSLRGPIT